MSAEPLDVIDHVTIVVSDVQRAVRWYTTSFRCSIEHQDARQAILRYQNIKLVLVLPSLQQPHLAFVKADAASFGELTPALEGGHSTFVSDAVGNLVELLVAEDS